MGLVTRRAFVGSATATLAATASGNARVTADPSQSIITTDFINLLRFPDRLIAYAEPPTERSSSQILLKRSGEQWQASGIQVTTRSDGAALAIVVEAATLPLLRIHLRWQAKTSRTALYLGDAWERSYGDLAWRTFVPERVLPWYFASHDHGITHSYGVRTGAGAMCFWQVDSEGVSLWLDLCNGGGSVLLGQRSLAAATVLTRCGQPGEQPLVALTEFCKQLSPSPRLPTNPVYGTNDWYYAYGKNTAEGILRDTELVASLSPSSGPRPYSVIDDGWRDNPAFPDMAELATQIKQSKVHPGIWIRPLQASKLHGISPILSDARLRTQDRNHAYDPTIPEGLEAALTKVKEAIALGYELIKHDFSTYDLLGQWGFTMGATPALPGWHLNDRSKTNAEVILDLYRSIRLAAGEQVLLLGCNTVGHLSAGIFELQRTGDDTSGRDWERTRRMGVNTLSYRLPQHRTFFDLDADCVGITTDVPWSLNAQWLDLVARSGTSLFLSPGPNAIGSEQKSAIREAFSIAANSHSTGYPKDWLTTTAPEDWSFSTGGRRYNFTAPDGTSPFSV